MKRSILLALLSLAVSCCPSDVIDVPGYPDILPDIIGVTVPEDIAPLRFTMKDGSRFKTKYRHSGDTLWAQVTSWSKGSSAAIRHTEFPIVISHSEIDPYITYRLIEPGYEGWRDMGIYERQLSSYKETAIVTNRINDQGCINCHTFNAGNPNEFLFHARGKGGGTVFVSEKNVQLVNLAGIGPLKQGTYPSWHPGGRYVAFSSNTTKQNFTVTDSQPLEVYDTASDIILLDLQDMSVSCPPHLSGEECLETFPSWSSDGSRLYFCQADTVSDPVIDRSEIHYKLMVTDFCNGKFKGEPRIVWQSDSASASFPRVNGNYLLFTRSSYGTFPIWHKEADLCLINLLTGEFREVDELNSPDTESYHSWSSNGEWLIFSSRRLDGRYTRLFITHFDENGRFSKPFLLPQRKSEYNDLRLKSYNIPEFVKGKVGSYEAAIGKLF